MDNAAFTHFTTTAADMTKSFVANQKKIIDMVAESAKGTPVAPFVTAAAAMQRTTLESFETMAASMTATTAKAGSKKAAKSAASSAEPMVAATQTIKKAVDAQADLMVDAGAQTVAATSKTKDAVAKAADSAAKGDVAALYEDLTAVTGIGPATMKKLQSEGIRTISDLAKTSVKDLTEIIEKTNVRILKFTPSDWIADAKALVKNAKAA